MAVGLMASEEASMQPKKVPGNKTHGKKNSDRNWGVILSVFSCGIRAWSLTFFEFQGPPCKMRF